MTARVMGIILKNFIFVWNIKRLYVSKDIQNKVWFLKIIKYKVQISKNNKNFKKKIIINEYKNIKFLKTTQFF